MRLFIGLDPGASGALACLNERGQCLEVYNMPATHLEVYQVLRSWQERGAGYARAWLEGVNAHPKQGVVSVFTFGKNVGGLECALDLSALEWDLVYPLRWQNALNCRTGGNKNITKQAAAALFPGIRVTHANADALLIAEYGRRLHVTQRREPHGKVQGRTEQREGQTRKGRQVAHGK